MTGEALEYARKATYFRTALLLGLVRGDVVHAWAEEVIADESRPLQAFIEIASTPVDDLSEMRHALWPLVVDPPPREVVLAILGLAQSQLAAGRRSVDDSATIVRQLRSMVKLPRDIYDAVNVALLAHGSASRQGEFTAWLRQFEGLAL